MTITNHVEKVKDGLRQNRFTSEAAVSQGILLPALLELGWPVFDTSVVVPEYSLEGRRVDFALFYPADRPVVFMEVKKVGKSEGADRQLFEYAFHAGVPMAILTDGQEWSFYLPGEQGRYDERRVYKLDLLERSIEEAGDRLERYLGYERVCSGEALKAARSDYKNVARDRTIEATFPKAWTALIEEQDSLLLDLLAEKVEDRCGYKPDLDACSQFLEKKVKGRGLVEPLRLDEIAVKRKKREREPHQISKQVKYAHEKPRELSLSTSKRTVKTWKEVLLGLCGIVIEQHPSDLEKFLKLDKYFSRNPSNLHTAVEISPGIFVETNRGAEDIMRMCNRVVVQFGYSEDELKVLLV